MIEIIYLIYITSVLTTLLMISDDLNISVLNLLEDEDFLELLIWSIVPMFNLIILNIAFKSMKKKKDYLKDI